MEERASLLTILNRRLMLRLVKMKNDKAFKVKPSMPRQLNSATQSEYPYVVTWDRWTEPEVYSSDMAMKAFLQEADRLTQFLILTDFCWKQDRLVNVFPLRYSGDESVEFGLRDKHSADWLVDTLKYIRNK